MRGSPASADLDASAPGSGSVHRLWTDPEFSARRQDAAKRVPTDWRQQLGRRNRFHYVRVAVIVTAFVLLVVALV